MEKLLSNIKTLYKLICILGFIYFAARILNIYRTEKETITIANLISALVIILLIWGALTSFYLLTTGVLRRIASKSEIDKRKLANHQIIKGIKTLVIVIFVWFLINLVSASFRMYIPSFTPPHFRTNIFTGQCDYGGESGNIEHDPWYYKPDCSIEKKIKIAKEKGFYSDRLAKCKKYCESLQKNYFCNTYIISVGDAWGNGPENLICTEIIDCPQIDCITH